MAAYNIGIQTIVLKQLGPNQWQMFAPAGHNVSEIRYFDGKDQAEQWARAWISSNTGLFELEIQELEDDNN